MFGARFVGTLADSNQSAVVTNRFKVTNGVTITKGDFVYLASGKLTNASIATQKLVGVANETVVGTGSNTCAIIVNPTALYAVDNDNLGTTFAATLVGTYFALTGATGAQQVDTSTTTTTGQLFAVEYNPQISGLESTTSIGLFMIAAPAMLGRSA